MAASVGKKLRTGHNYVTFLAELKEWILAARALAVRAVNRDLVLLYWDIGQAIVAAVTVQLGDGVIRFLANDLKRSFPGKSGFSPQNLWRMRQFYLRLASAEFLSRLTAEGPTSPDISRKPLLSQAVREGSKMRPATHDPEILSQAVRELAAAVPWGHHVNLLTKISEPRAHIYYLRATAQFGWSRNVLLNQIKAGAYERSLADGKTHNFPASLPDHLAELAEEALKSSYNLEFPGIAREIKERELEDRLIDELQQFILELGYGFCFIGRKSSPAGQKGVFRRSAFLSSLSQGVGGY